MKECDVMEDNLYSAMSDVNTKFEDVSPILDDIQSGYSAPLDEVMKKIYNDIISSENPELPLVQKYFMELTNTLYFMTEKVEQLGLYDDISKSAAKDVYNNAYIKSTTVPTESGKKPTVAEITANAEKESLYQTTVNTLYDRAYRIFKAKYDSGYEMVKCLSKVISSRMQEMALASTDNDIGTRKVLLENQDIV
jgi:hypothetical protein